MTLDLIVSDRHARAVGCENTLHSLARYKQPEEAWEADLIKLVIEKKAEGSVIVIGDFNDNLNMIEGKINKMFHDLDMKEILNARYGEGPATYFLG